MTYEKKILIPTDFSQNAGDALAYALAFLGNEKARLHIIHVVNTNVIVGDAPAAAADMIKMQMDHATESMKALEAFGNTSNNKHITVSTGVHAGPTSPIIKREAEKIDADLIIMGTRGDQHNKMDKWLGSVSSNVIEEAPCPIILVPHDYKFKPIDNVIFCTSINHNDPYELWRGIQRIHPNTAVVRALHVTTDDKDEVAKRVDDFAQYLVTASPKIDIVFDIINGENVEASIEDYAEKYDAEMIIMHREKRNFWNRIFTKSHTKKMTSIIKLPLLIMN